MRRTLLAVLPAVTRMREHRRLYACEEAHLAEVLGHAVPLVAVVPQQRQALRARTLAS